MISKEPPVVFERGEEVNVVTLLSVLWRYRYLVIASALVCGLLAVYIAMTTRFVYSAEVVVTEVANGNMGDSNSLASRLGGLASLAGVNLMGSGAGREAQAVLRSRYLSEEFIRRNDLHSKLLRGSSKEQQTLWFAVDAFRKKVLAIRDEKTKGTTIVEIKWSDPRESAQWANDYVALANEIMRTRALEEASRNVKFLNEQIAKTDVVELRRVLYSLIENETKTLMLASARHEYAFTVVDPAAVPESRIWPRRTLMVISGAFLGLFVGGFIALLHNFWRRYRRPLVET